MFETNNVELKREINDKLEKEVVSFLNSNGGHLFIGVNDDGTAYGVENIDSIQLLVKDRIKDKIRKIKEYQEEKKWQFVKSALLATHV